MISQNPFQTTVHANRKGSPGVMGVGRVGGVELRPELVDASNLGHRADAGPTPLETTSDRPEEIGRNSRADGGHGGDDAEHDQSRDEAVFDGRDARFIAGKLDE